MSLDQAMTRLAAGEKAAFDEIYRATRRTVYYIALSYVRERMLAEDVMQTTYLKVLGNASRYKKGTNASAWIARIARNEAIDLLRRRARELSVDERENPLPFGTQNVDDYGLLIDLARRILKQEEFSVLMLAATEGYKRREIAQMLSMPLPTVSWHYARAVKKLQHALQEEKREQRTGGGIVQRGELERELRREAEEHTPDVYERVVTAQPVGEAGEAVAAVRPRRPLIAAACVLAVLVIVLACVLPALFAGGGSAGLSGNLYININPAVEFIVEEDRVTGVRALNRDAALLISGEDFTGLSPEDAGEKFVLLSENKHLITAEGVGVTATGEDAAALEQRVRDRLAGSAQNYAVHDMSQSDLDALIAAYDEQAMGDFEDYLERELSHLRSDFAERVHTLMESYLSDLSAVFAGSMTQAAFNEKYLYLGEDCIFEDGDERQRELEENFAELQRDLERYGDDYIFDELFDEFIEAVEELYESDVEQGGDDDDDDNDDDDDDEDEDDEDDDDRRRDRDR